MSKTGEDPRKFAYMTEQISGNSQGHVSGLNIVQVEWSSAPDGEGSVMTRIPDSEEFLPADLIILAMGFTGPESDLIDELSISVDSNSNILSTYGDFTVRSSLDGSVIPGIFAAGDCRRGQSLVVWAINEGREAAEATHRYLEEITRDDRPIFAAN